MNAKTRVLLTGLGTLVLLVDEHPEEELVCNAGTQTSHISSIWAISRNNQIDTENTYPGIHTLINGKEWKGKELL